MHYSLNDHWKLYEAPLGADISSIRGEGLTCSLPCDVRMPLEKAGIIHDPVKADYSFESEWIENGSWWFVRSFDSGDIDNTVDTVELVIESIDAHSDIYLNRIRIGRHESAFYPFVCDIRDSIAEGENTLAVCVTTGLESVTQGDLAEIGIIDANPKKEREDARRAFVRKPAYTVGWDWGPKAVSCGIVKNAYINCHRTVAIRDVNLVTTQINDHVAVIHACVALELLTIDSTADADIRISWKLDHTVCAEIRLEDRLLRSGINFIDTDIIMQNPALWWPSGYGGQPLYKVEISAACRDVQDSWQGRFGIRTIDLDTERTDGKNRAFTLCVNGVPIFCKGGNWIPADSVYARVTDAKYDTLVSEAREANFNMLRVWGGGIYERDAFYEACDRYGILLWHDFMFACSAYPDHLEWFRRLVEHEMDYQTKRLRNHACMALWCGNNEDHWLIHPTDIHGNAVERTVRKSFGMHTGNVQAACIVQRNCAHIPYWNSSPYGGESPNDDHAGDVHHWGACMMNEDMEKRIDPFVYDLADARFISEYGYPGPCMRASMEEYFDGKPIDRNSRIWEHHNNTFEKHTVAAGIEKHYTNAERLDLDQYIYYAGLVQSEMLGYSLESFRFKMHCSGGLFWMYNDTWGEVGWTIIDYYMRRKISYYGVKRAFAPVKMILRTVGGKVLMTGCNDTEKDIVIQVKAGYYSLDGKTDKTETVTLRFAPRSREPIFETELPDEDYTRGLFVVIPMDILPSNHSGDAASDASMVMMPAVLRQYDRRKLSIPEGQPPVIQKRKNGSDLIVTLCSEIFMQGVYLDLERSEKYGQKNQYSDNYFDLLPHVEKTVVVTGGANAELKVGYAIV